MCHALFAIRDTIVKLSTSKETGAKDLNPSRNTNPTIKPIPVGFAAQPRLIPTNPSPITSASIDRDPAISSNVGINSDISHTILEEKTTYFYKELRAYLSLCFIAICH